MECNLSLQYVSGRESQWRQYGEEYLLPGRQRGSCQASDGQPRAALSHCWSWGEAVKALTKTVVQDLTAEVLSRLGFLWVLLRFIWVLPQHTPTSYQVGLGHMADIPLILAGAHLAAVITEGGSREPWSCGRHGILAEVFTWECVLMLATMCLQNVELVWWK